MLQLSSSRKGLYDGEPSHTGVEELQAVVSIDLDHSWGWMGPLDVELTWSDVMLLAYFHASSKLKLIFIYGSHKVSSKNGGGHFEICSVDLSASNCQIATIVGFDSEAGIVQVMNRDGDMQAISILNLDPVIAPMLLLHKQQALMTNQEGDKIEGLIEQVSTWIPHMIGPNAEQLKRGILSCLS